MITFILKRRGPWRRIIPQENETTSIMREAAMNRGEGGSSLKRAATCLGGRGGDPVPGGAVEVIS